MRKPLYPILTLALFLLPAIAEAQGILPKIDISIGGGNASGPAQMTTALKILALMTILSLAPSIIIMCTCFTRIVIVLSFVRQSIGVQGVPPNQVMMGLALLLTFFVMAPVGKKIQDNAITPYMDGKITEATAWEKGVAPLRRFMLDQTRVKDLQFFIDLSQIEQPKKPADVPIYVIIPAFVISELTAAFHMGFFIFIPFLVLDFVMSSILMAMGMQMLPPALISLPMKVMLFVLVDGWHLVVGSLVRSFAV